MGLSCISKGIHKVTEGIYTTVLQKHTHMHTHTHHYAHCHCVVAKSVASETRNDYSKPTQSTDLQYNIHIFAHKCLDMFDLGLLSFNQVFA